MIFASLLRSEDTHVVEKRTMSREMYIGELAFALILTLSSYTSALPELSEFMGFRPALMGIADIAQYADTARWNESPAQPLRSILENRAKIAEADSLCLDRCFSNWTTSLPQSDILLLSDCRLTPSAALLLEGGLKPVLQER